MLSIVPQQDASALEITAELRIQKELSDSFAEAENVTILSLIRAIKTQGNKSFLHMAAQVLMSNSDLASNLNGCLLMESLLEMAGYHERELLNQMMNYPHLSQHHAAIIDAIELLYYEPLGAY